MQQPAEILTRMAPTPSGYLHRGNLFNFLLNWLYARKNGGRVLLRIDDLDAARMRTEYLGDIFRVLELFGLDWDLGPTEPADFLENWSQNGHTDRYEAWLKTLQDKGLTYACSCSRSGLQKAGFSGAYPGLCRHKNLPYLVGSTALRLNMELVKTLVGEDVFSYTHDLMGTAWQGMPADPVVRRRDGVAAYHIASVADDVYHGVTHAFRGMDLLESTVIQRALAAAAGHPEFLAVRFGHHELMADAQGAKLSKSAGADAVAPLGSGQEAVSQVLLDFARWQQMDLRGQLPQRAADLLLVG